MRKGAFEEGGFERVVHLMRRVYVHRADMK
jgi:hypothetical protein